MGQEAVVWAQLEQAEATIRHAKEAVRQMREDEMGTVREWQAQVVRLSAENADLRAALTQAEAERDAVLAEWHAEGPRWRRRCEEAEARAARYRELADVARRYVRIAVHREIEVWESQQVEECEWIARLENAVDAALAGAPGDRGEGE